MCLNPYSYVTTGNFSCLQKIKNDLETPIQVIRIYSQDIGIEFDIEKCAMLILKVWKRQISEEIKLANQEKNQKVGEKENYKYLELLETDIIKQVEIKEENNKGFS